MKQREKVKPLPRRARWEEHRSTRLLTPVHWLNGAKPSQTSSHRGMRRPAQDTPFLQGEFSRKEQCTLFERSKAEGEEADRWIVYNWISLCTAWARTGTSPWSSRLVTREFIIHLASFESLHSSGSGVEPTTSKLHELTLEKRPLAP